MGGGRRDEAHGGRRLGCGRVVAGRIGHLCGGGGEEGSDSTLEIFNNVHVLCPLTVTVHVNVIQWNLR